MRPLGKMFYSHLKFSIFFKVLFEIFDFLLFMATLINHSNTQFWADNSKLKMFFLFLECGSKKRLRIKISRI